MLARACDAHSKSKKGLGGLKVKRSPEVMHLRPSIQGDMNLQACTHPHTHACEHTHTSADRLLPATGQVNRALIKPWSEFEQSIIHLELLMLRLPGDGRAGSEGGTDATTHTDAAAAVKDQPRVVSIPFADEGRIIWIKWTSLPPELEWLPTRRAKKTCGTKECQKEMERSNLLRDTWLSKQSGKVGRSVAL